MAGKGITNPLFFIGVVEDVLDEARMGRVRVRAHGVHGTKKEVPTETLPWATCVQGNYDPNSPVPPMNSFVFGMFLDGEEGQHPMVLGLIPGQYTEKADPAKDEWGIIPPFAKALLGWLGGPEDIGQVQKAKLQRVEDIDETYIGPRDANALQQQKIADSDLTWGEPGPAYAARYPHNRVIETPGGHSIELDDTPGAERISINHTSGAYIEIDAKGTFKERAQGDRYEINIGTKHESSGHSVVTINGNSHVYVKGNKTEEIMGNYKRIVHGENEVTVGGQSYHNVGGHLFMRGASTKIEGNADRVTIFGRKEVQIEAEKQVNTVSGHIKNTAMLTFSAYANKAVRFTTPGDIHLYALGQIINTAQGVTPASPLTGSVGVPTNPGFNINAPFVNIGGWSTGTVPAPIATVMSVNGLLSADVGNFDVATAPTINCGVALNATAITANAVNTTILAAPPPIAPSGGGPCLPGPGRLTTVAAVPAIPTISIPALPTISIFAPSIAPGTISGLAYPQGNGDGFLATVLTSPLSVLGFDINILPDGGLGIPRIQMPQPASHGCSIIPNGYFSLGHAMGYISDQDERQNQFTLDIAGDFAADLDFLNTEASDFNG
jgi:hypothetical protein